MDNEKSAADSGPRRFLTLNEAKAHTPFQEGEWVETAGFHTPGDGGGALYRIQTLGDTLGDKPGDTHPNDADIIALEDGLAAVLHESEADLGPSEGGSMNRYNFSLPHTVEGYPTAFRDQASEILAEGWAWLEREGLIVPKPGTQGEWIIITRRGRQLRTREDFESFRRSDILPRHLLHPTIAASVWSPFIRGEYDTSVFNAFKQVEVAVRDAGGYEDQDYGTDLARKAFHVDQGPLTDSARIPAERQALSDLFAGSIGLYKNPHSHRNVPLTAEEAAEMIVLASHLMNIVEARSST
jgi:uncharacterized protein (TIGR02391 family)